MRRLANGLRDPREGVDVPSAAQQRLVNRILRVLSNIRGERGVEVRVTERGVVVAGPRRRERTVLDAVVTNAPPADVKIMPGDCVYNVEVVGQPAAGLVEAMPKYGRPVRSDGGPAGKGEFAIYPAKLNDRCFVVVERDESNEIIRSLWVISEQIAGAACSPPASARGRGGGPAREPEQLPEPAPIAPSGGAVVGGAGEVGAPGRP